MADGAGARSTNCASAEVLRALELDLIGREVTLSEQDADVLLAGAEAGSGSSIGSRDLATRLKELALQSPHVQRRLVLSRPESRALQRMIETQLEPAGDQLLELRQTLTEVLAHRIDGVPERRETLT